MDSINPYDLLGVTIDSTPEDVRKSYHSLALLVHPDRGGSAVDMMILQSAYECVIFQINSINRTTSFDDLSAERSCNSTVLADIREIEDAFYQRLSLQEMCFADGAFWRASYAGGYGESMANVECTGDNLTTPVLPFASHQLVVYEEMHANVGAPVEPTALDAQVDDFSILENPLHASDYRMAHSCSSLDDSSFSCRTVEQLIAERDLLHS